MALLDDIKVALRVVDEGMDAEVQMLVDAALYDMERAGVNPALLELNEEGNLDNALVKKGVTVLCKADFGYDVNEAHRFEASYDRILNALLNSSENVAAMAALPDGGEGGEEPAEEPGDGREEGE